MWHDYGYSYWHVQYRADEQVCDQSQRRKSDKKIKRKPVTSSDKQKHILSPVCGSSEWHERKFSIYFIY